jgi:hypothetical protein
MPQFDTFSFFSQITWTFFFFGLIFLLNSYSLFPVAAVVLKTRALKSWSQSLTSSESLGVTTTESKSISHPGGYQAFIKWSNTEKSANNLLFFNIISLRNFKF